MYNVVVDVVQSPLMREFAKSWSVGNVAYVDGKDFVAFFEQSTTEVGSDESDATQYD